MNLTPFFWSFNAEINKYYMYILKTSFLVSYQTMSLVNKSIYPNGDNDQLLISLQCVKWCGVIKKDMMSNFL